MEPSHLVPALLLWHHQIWMTPFLPRTSGLTTPFPLPAAVSLSSVALNVSFWLNIYLLQNDVCLLYYTNCIVELSLFIVLHLLYCSLYYNMQFLCWANMGKYSTYHEHLIFLYVRKLFLFLGNLIDRLVFRNALMFKPRTTCIFL
jgi:hypothetical protein